MNGRGVKLNVMELISEFRDETCKMPDTKNCLTQLAIEQSISQDEVPVNGSLRRQPLELTLQEVQAIETEIVQEIAHICIKHQIPYFLHCGSALGAVRHQGPIPWDSDVDIIVPYNRFTDFCNTIRQELPERFYLDYLNTNRDYVALFPRIGLTGYSTKILHVDVFRLIGISSFYWKQCLFTGLTNILKRMSYFKMVRPDISFSANKLIYYRMMKYFLTPIPRNWIIRIFDWLCRKYPYEEAVYVTNPSGHYGRKNIQPREVYGKGRSAEYSGIEVVIPEQFNRYLKHYYKNYMKPPGDIGINMKKTYIIRSI